MWIVVPVKSFRYAKCRLAPVLSKKQRVHLSHLLLADLLATLCMAKCVQGITVVGSDPSLAEVATGPVKLQLVKSDEGYGEDAIVAVNNLPSSGIEKVAIMPIDVPTITPSEVEYLDQVHQSGITLCPAAIDGGTNAIVFTPPLTLPLQFGPSSFNKHIEAATGLGLDIHVVRLPGLERDIDRPDDLIWLSSQPSGGLSWDFARRILSTPYGNTHISLT